MSGTTPPSRSILFSLLSAFWRDARLTLLLVVLASLIGAIGTVAAPVLFSRAIDLLSAGTGVKEAWRLILLYALIFGFATALSKSAQYLVFMCAERLSFVADCAFFSQLLHKPSAFFLDRNATEIGNARREGSQALGLFVQFGISGLLPGLTQIVVSLLLLGGLVSWETALIVVGYGAVVIALDYFRVARVNPALDAAIERTQQSASLIGNAIGVIETLRHTRSERWMAERFKASAGDAFANWRRYSVVSSVFSAASGIALAVQLVVTFFLLLPRYEAGSITIGELVLFNALLLQLNEPFHLVGEALKESADAMGRFRPFATMWSAPEESDATSTGCFHPSDGTIAFHGVTFTYPNGRGVHGLSFEVRRGAPTFLIGETGSGKSTVLRMLLKDIRPESGQIVVDGEDLSAVTRDDWFAHVGVVPQEVSLLNDSIAANIVLGRPLDEARLRRAAERASILQRIEAMPEGFGTVVGERGMKLSGGERQRIAIARALYSEPSILILDEASSALDADTEAEVMNGLRSLSSNLTILLVTHRISTIQPGDQVIRLPAPSESLDCGSGRYR